MITQQDVITAIDESDQQLRTIADQVRIQPNALLHEGTWTVRDMVCHIAASSNYATLFSQIQERGGKFPTLDQLNETNAHQIAERTGHSIDELLEEAFGGFTAARESAHAFTDAELAKPGLSATDGEPLTIGDLVMIVYRSHALPHIATLEQAVRTTD